MRFKALLVAFLSLGSYSYLRADLFINEFDYDQVSVDTSEWVEIVGTAGLSLNPYELLFINGANGLVYKTVDLALTNFTFVNETGTGWGFFVLGVASEYGVSADFTPTAWTSDQIQNGAPDSIQLRLKAGPTNIHLIDYEGQNSSTTEDQMTILADSNTTAQTSLHLTGTGNSFADFTFSLGLGTPGSLNVGQTLTAVPEAGAFAAMGLVGLISAGAVWLRKRRAGHVAA